MLSDSRYSYTDVFTSLSRIKDQDCKLLDPCLLDEASTVRLPVGTFSPSSILNNEDVLLLASVLLSQRMLAIESYIRLNSPIVIALNTVSSIASEYIDYRISCHPHV